MRSRGGKLAHLVLLAASVLTVGMVLSTAGVAAASKLPHRNTSAHPDCAHQPGYPKSVVVPVIGGRTFPIVAGIDANGCNSWPYELASSVGIPGRFFAGTDFLPGIRAFEYGTRETTTLVKGHQLISVTNPTQEWRSVYAGYDVCHAQATKTVCLAPAVDPRPDDLILYVPAGILLGGLVLFTAHYLRPAGPLRRRRHFHHARSLIAQGVTPEKDRLPDAVDVRQLQRRLRRLEKFLSPQLSESQHRWFTGHLATGRHGMALESVARWLAESEVPVPDHIREEALWIASSIDVERVVRPILDHQVQLTSDELESAPSVSEGFDVPLEQFTQLVADAVDSLPEAFGRAMTNVAITVEEEAEGRNAFGVYIGHPLSKARFRQWSIHPDKIIIYRKTICDSCQSEEQVKAQVYRTVIHEIAHHFGIDDPRLRELGW
jgi:predicted Zn-dependent protease with MMP-like domain